MTDYVFDTEPLIAYFYDEPGAVDVTERLQAIESEEAMGAISHVGKKDLRILRGYGVTIETPSWSTVARIKGAGGISLGDSYAVALALEEEATLVVGADPEFGGLPEDIDLHRIRDESV